MQRAEELRRGAHTWSKWVRTRRCQSLRKSVGYQHDFLTMGMHGVELTVVLYLLVVLDRLSWLRSQSRSSKTSIVHA